MLLLSYTRKRRWPSKPKETRMSSVPDMVATLPAAELSTGVPRYRHVTPCSDCLANTVSAYYQEAALNVAQASPCCCTSG
jgi:hypothetical protein